MELLLKEPVIPPLVSPGGRSPGVHVSAVLRKVAIAIGVPNLEGDFPDLEPGPTTSEFILHNDAYDGQVRIAAGLAFEEYMAKAFPSIEYHPGEFELDDVFGSPDGFSYESIPMVTPGEVTIVEEFKFTDKSSRWDPLSDELKWWLWLHQMMAYCHMCDTPYARLWALHNRGDYAAQRISMYRYLFRFSEEDLEGVWKMILKNK